MNCPRNNAIYIRVSGTHVTCGPADGDGPSTVGPLGPLGSTSSLSGRGSMTTIRRGPGRPRLRPSGPGNQGYRNPVHHHSKKIQRPLPVPIRSHQTIATIGQQKVSSQCLSSTPGSSAVVSVATKTPSSSADSRPFGFYTQQQSRESS